MAVLPTPIYQLRYLSKCYL